jgi:O-antigen ligase
MAALIALFALAIIAPMLEGTSEAAAGYRRIGYPIVAAVAILGLWPPANPVRLLVVPWPLVAALAWCWLSLTWADNPQEALVRLVLTTLVAFTAFATVRHLGYGRALAAIRIVLAIALLLNYATVILYPNVGVDRHPFYWSEFQWLGFMAHKNFAGALCAFTVIAFVFDVEPRWRVPFLGVAAAAALFLVLTVSRTPLIAGAAGLVLGGIVLASYRRLGLSLLEDRRSAWRITGYGLIALFFAIILYFTFNSDAFLAMMTDPDALSRRTVVWRQLMQAYADQPWSGVGFGSYWTKGQSDATTGSAAWLGVLDQGHNGVLDILVQVGLPGLVLVFVAAVVWPVRALARQIATLPQASALLTALLVLCLVSNCTESGLLARDALWNVLLMLTLALIAASWQQIDPRRAPWIAVEDRREAARRRSTSRTRRSPGADPERSGVRRSSRSRS